LSQAYGISRKDDIVDILKDFYGTDKFVETNLITFLTNISEDFETTNQGIAGLADIDPKFKNFLISKFGWNFED
jgi:hypothetical protein